MRTDESSRLREQRSHHLARLQEILDKNRGGDLTADEASEFDKLEREVRSIDAMLRGNGNGGRPGVEFATTQRTLAAAFRENGWPGESAEIGWEEYRAFTWTGSVDNLNPLSRESGPFGADQRYVWPAIPQTAVGSDVTAVNTLAQTARTLPSAANVVRAIDAVTAKPEVASTMTLNVTSLKQVAAIVTNVPNIVLEQDGAESVIQTDLRLSLNEGLDKLVNDAIAASGFQAPGTDPLLISIRKAMSTIMGSGYNPNLLVLRPADAEALDTLRATTTAAEQYYVFAPANFAPDAIFGMQKRISKVVAAPVVMDAEAFGRMYAGPLRLDKFEADAGTTNRSNVRMELNAAMSVERQAAALRIAAS
jgi:hypothetical protein